MDKIDRGFGGHTYTEITKDSRCFYKHLHILLMNGFSVG
jgi:hypothetical protein